MEKTLDLQISIDIPLHMSNIDIDAFVNSLKNFIHDRDGMSILRHSVELSLKGDYKQ